jgi:hypothetical protein
VQGEPCGGQIRPEVKKEQFIRTDTVCHLIDSVDIECDAFVSVGVSITATNGTKNVSSLADVEGIDPVGVDTRLIKLGKG